MTEIEPVAKRTNYTPLIVLATLIGISAWIISLLVPDPLPIFGIMYVAGFLALASFYPEVALILTFAAGPFQNDLSKGAISLHFSIVEINILLLLIVLFFRVTQRTSTLKVGSVVAAALLYIAICLASTLPQQRSEVAVTVLVQTALYLIVTVVIYAAMVTNKSTFEKMCTALIGVCVFLSAFVLVSRTAYVLGLHKNGVGSSLATGAIVATELWLRATGVRRKWMLAGALTLIVAGLIVSVSRGAWIGAATGILILLLIRRQFRTLFQMILGLVPLVWIMWSSLPQDKRDSATNFDAKGDNVRLRLKTIDYCWQAFRQNPMTGEGVALRKNIDATNLILITLGETGVPGLIALLFIHVQIARICFNGQAMVGKRDIRFSTLAIAAAIVGMKFAHGCVDHYWGRGTLSIEWASVGVATGLYHDLLRDRARSVRSKFLAKRTLEPAQ